MSRVYRPTRHNIGHFGGGEIDLAFRDTYTRNDVTTPVHVLLLFANFVPEFMLGVHIPNILQKINISYFVDAVGLHSLRAFSSYIGYRLYCS